MEGHNRGRRSRHEHKTPFPSQPCRAIETSAQLNRDCRGQCSRVWYIVQADPAGILPKWLVNMCATKQVTDPPFRPPPDPETTHPAAASILCSAASSLPPPRLPFVHLL